MIFEQYRVELDTELWLPRLGFCEGPAAGPAAGQDQLISSSAEFYVLLVGIS